MNTLTRTYINISDFDVKFINLLTAREATIVETTAAGTLNMIDITAFRFSSMKTVAMRFARNLGGELHG